MLLLPCLAKMLLFCTRITVQHVKIYYKKWKYFLA